MARRNGIVLGIDLGTVESRMAVLDARGNPAGVANGEGDPATPSVVHYDAATKRATVGTRALDEAVESPAETAEHPKRHLGENEYPFRLAGGHMNATMACACILKKLAREGGEKLGQRVSGVVLAHPSGFDAAQKRALKGAGELAGLDVLAVIGEPVAEALAYKAAGGARREEDDETVLVYDFGGGKVDASVVRMKGTGVELVCTAGNARLGGVDWTERLAERLAGAHAAAHGGRADWLMRDVETAAELRAEAERAKRALTVQQKVVCKVTHGGKTTRVEVGRAQFEAWTQDLLEKAAKVAETVAKAAQRRGVTTFDRAVLTGCGSRMPQVPEALRACLGRRLTGGFVAFEPGMAVAKGAALYGAMLPHGMRTEVEPPETGPARAFETNPYLILYSGVLKPALPAAEAQGLLDPPRKKGEIARRLAEVERCKGDGLGATDYLRQHYNGRLADIRAALLDGGASERKKCIEEARQEIEERFLAEAAKYHLGGEAVLTRTQLAKAGAMFRRWLAPETLERLAEAAGYWIVDMPLAGDVSLGGTPPAPEKPAGWPDRNARLRGVVDKNIPVYLEFLGAHEGREIGDIYDFLGVEDGASLAAMRRGLEKAHRLYPTQNAAMVNRTPHLQAASSLFRVLDELVRTEAARRHWERCWALAKIDEQFQAAFLSQISGGRVRYEAYLGAVQKCREAGLGAEDAEYYAYEYFVVEKGAEIE